MENEAAKRSRPSQPHTMNLENRQRAALSGVGEVLAFDETQVILSTECGEMALTGEGLHVTRLMLEEGQLTVEGRIDGIVYTQRGSRRGLFFRKSK